MLTVKYGNTGETVRKLQSALKRAGYSLSVDGVFGAKTTSTVKKFQTANGLVADGIVGAKTWDKLSRYLIDTEALGEAVMLCLNDISELDSFKKVMELVSCD